MRSTLMTVSRTFRTAIALLSFTSGAVCAELPDIESVPPDLTLPAVIQAPPAPGLRVPAPAPGWEATTAYHLLYLPTNWKPSTKFPVLVEWTGNQYKSPTGDSCPGTPEGAKLGFGISGGVDCIWLTLPYLDNSGKHAVSTWWGNAPEYDPRPTLAYCRAAVRDVCERFGGDPARVVLAGFSRGAIAVNYLGLHDAETAQLWRGFICYSHYDGVRRWNWSNTDTESATARLKRLAGRPQFVCGEANNAEETRLFLERSGLLRAGAFTFLSTGFRNHNDAWLLRPSEQRTQLRTWFRQLVQ
jgi:hypothetical protein